MATLLALLCGLRAGEILGLRPADVDEGELTIGKAKTEAGVRRVLLPASLQQLVERAVPFAGGHDWLRYHCRRLCRAAEVDEVTPHGLRGTHSSLATSAGASPEIVSQSLGHASTAVTARHYTTEDAAGEGRQRRVLEVLDGGKKAG